MPIFKILPWDSPEIGRVLSPVEVGPLTTCPTPGFSTTKVLRRNFHSICNRARFWDPCSAPLKSFDVELDGFHNQSARIFQGWAGCYTAGKVRDVGAPVAGHLLKHHHVFHHFFHPACLIIEFNVPGDSSSFGWPATVTVSESGLPSWTNWR
jgi:hypothetical protein